MPTFTYQAMNSKGQEVKDEIDASSSEDALGKIRSKGLFPTSVRQKSGKGKGKGGAKRPGGAKKAGTTLALGGVSSKQLTQFTRQLSTLQDAGLPVVRSIKILRDQMKPGVLKNSLITVADDVEGGNTFSEALGKHPKCFDKLYVNMVKAGEAGGVLDTILQRLADFREKSQKLKKQVVSAMVYPVAVITIAGGILAGIMILIIPKFEEMFIELNIELPPPTVILIKISGIMQNYWYLLPLTPFAIIVLFKLTSASNGGRYALDLLKLKIPLFGMIISKTTISRFTRTLGTLISSGVPILEALNIVKETAGNEVISRAITKVHDSIREGESIAQPLGQAKICDEMVVNMIDVGEETGDLDKMLLKVADTYDEDVDAAVSGMMSLIEPLLIIFMGGSIGFIVIALFMPLIKLMSAM